MSEDYADGRVECVVDGLRLRGYSFPWGMKHVAYSSIRGVQRVDIGAFTGRARIWGTSNPRYWANFDPRRPKKTVGLVLDIGKSVKPFITPDDPGVAEAVIRERAKPGAEAPSRGPIAFMDNRTQERVPGRGQRSPASPGEDVIIAEHWTAPVSVIGLHESRDAPVAREAFGGLGGFPGRAMAQDWLPERISTASSDARNAVGHDSLESHEPLDGRRSRYWAGDCRWRGGIGGDPVTSGERNHGLRASWQQRRHAYLKCERDVSKALHQAFLERDRPQGCHRCNWAKCGFEFHHRRDSGRGRRGHGHCPLPWRRPFNLWRQPSCNRWRRFGYRSCTAQRVIPELHHPRKAANHPASQ